MKCPKCGSDNIYQSYHPSMRICRDCHYEFEVIKR